MAFGYKLKTKCINYFDSLYILYEIKQSNNIKFRTMLINILNVRWKDEATKNLFGIGEILQIIINAGTKNLHIQGSMHMYSTPYTGMTCVNGYFDCITAAIKTPTNGYCAIKIEPKFDGGIVEVNGEIFVSKEFAKRCERFNHNLTNYVCTKNQESDKEE